MVDFLFLDRWCGDRNHENGDDDNDVLLLLLLLPPALVGVDVRGVEDDDVIVVVVAVSQFPELDVDCFRLLENLHLPMLIAMTSWFALPAIKYRDNIVCR